MEPAGETPPVTPLASNDGSALGFLTSILQRKYDLWALNNSESVSHVETSLKTLLFFLPGRFREQELSSELFQSVLNLFGVFNDSIWLKYTASEGRMKPPPSSIHEDLAARLGISTKMTPDASSSTIDNRPTSEQWADQYNTFSQIDDKQTALAASSAYSSANDSSTPTPQQQIDPKSLFGSGQISADVQRKLSKLHRRLPQSIHRNFSLHALLSVLDHTELVMEIGTSHVRDWLRAKLGGGVVDAGASRLTSLRQRAIDGLKFLVIFTIESIKALIRLILLVRNGGKVLAYQSIPQRDAVVRTLAVEEDQQRLVETLAARLNGKQLRKTLSDLEKEKRKVIPTPASFAITIGEILWIIRPLLYLLSLMKFGKNSWKPWFISLLVDLASRSCSYSTQLNEYETQEMYRRGFLWFFYLMRSPFFEFAVGSSDGSSSRFAPLFNLLQKVPLLNLLTSSLGEFFHAYRKRYFYTAGSSS